jgi:hypothetical protein
MLSLQIELGEMQRVLASKERSVDSLRDTLAATKRSFEARLAQAEGTAALREAEVSSGACGGLGVVWS